MLLLPLPLLLRCQDCHCQKAPASPAAASVQAALAQHQQSASKETAQAAASAAACRENTHWSYLPPLKKHTRQPNRMTGRQCLPAPVQGTLLGRAAFEVV
jgi:hypothetical protein